MNHKHVSMKQMGLSRLTLKYDNANFRTNNRIMYMRPTAT